MVNDINKNLLSFLLGGINNNGDYNKRSLAKLIRLIYKEFVDPREFVNYVSFYGEEGLKKIKVVCEEHPEDSFLNLLRMVNIQSKKILLRMENDLAGMEDRVNETFMEIMGNPETITKVLSMLYRSILKFDASHNYYTFFIISVGSIHWRYLSHAYPKLSKSNIFMELKKFLDLAPIYIPKLEDEQLNTNYTLWGYRPEGFSYNIYLLQLILWEILREEALSSNERYEILGYVTEKPEKTYANYVNQIRNALKGYILPPDLSELGRYGVAYRLRIEKSDVVEFYNSYSPNYYKYVSRRNRMPLPKLLDSLGPELFVGSRLYPTRDNDELIYFSILKETPRPLLFKDILYELSIGEY